MITLGQKSKTLACGARSLRLLWNFTDLRLRFSWRGYKHKPYLYPREPSHSPELIVQFAFCLVLFIFAAYPDWAEQIAGLVPRRGQVRGIVWCQPPPPRVTSVCPDQLDMGKLSVTVLANYYKQWPPCQCQVSALISCDKSDMGTVLFLTLCIKSKSAEICTAGYKLRRSECCNGVTQGRCIWAGHPDLTLCWAQKF